MNIAVKYCSRLNLVVKQQPIKSSNSCDIARIFKDLREVQGDPIKPEPIKILINPT